MKFSGCPVHFGIEEIPRQREAAEMGTSGGPHHVPTSKTPCPCSRCNEHWHTRRRLRDVAARCMPCTTQERSLWGPRGQPGSALRRVSLVGAVSMFDVCGNRKQKTQPRIDTKSHDDAQEESDSSQCSLVRPGQKRLLRRRSSQKMERPQANERDVKLGDSTNEIRRPRNGRARTSSWRRLRPKSWESVWKSPQACRVGEHHAEQEFQQEDPGTLGLSSPPNALCRTQPAERQAKGDRPGPFIPSREGTCQVASGLCWSCAEESQRSCGSTQNGPGNKKLSFFMIRPDVCKAW